MNPFKLKSTQMSESVKENSAPEPGPATGENSVLPQTPSLSNGNGCSVGSSRDSGRDDGAKMSSFNFRGGIIIPHYPPSLSPTNQPVQFPFQRARVITPTPSQDVLVPESTTNAKQDADEVIIMELIARETRTLMDNLFNGNFDELAPKFKALPLETRKGRISTFINVVYDKAIERSSFSSIYARMLQTMCTSSPNPEDIAKQFTRAIRKYYNRFIIASRTSNVTKWNALNYFIFIEELYRAQLLTGKLTVTAVHFALYNGTPNSQVLDSVCHLLRTIGQQLEADMEPTWKLKMLTRLEQLMSNEEISATVRSILLGLVQLWRNNWNPIRNELLNGCGPLFSNFRISSPNIDSNGSDSDACASSSSHSTIDNGTRENGQVPDVGVPQFPTKQGCSKSRTKYDRATLLMIRDSCNIQEFKTAEQGFPTLAVLKPGTSRMQLDSKSKQKFPLHREQNGPFMTTTVCNQNFGDMPDMDALLSSRSRSSMESQASIHLPAQTEESNSNKSENEWRTMSSTSITKDDPETEEVIIKSIVERARNMLSKLTPDSFSKLESSFLALPLEHKDDRISTFLAVMFEKAVGRPSSSSAYARMLHTICKASSQMEETKAKFAIHIVRQAHLEACEISQNKKEIRKLQKKMAPTKDNENAVKEERKRLNRERAIGFVTFIGELYKAEMITPKIVVSRINSLVNVPDDVENFECACVLLRNVGHMLEMALSVEDNVPTSILNSKWMDKIFGALEKSVKTNMMLEAPEQRKAIEGLVMLRKNGWKSQDHQSKISIDEDVVISSTSGTDLSVTPVSEKAVSESPTSGKDMPMTPVSGKNIPATPVSGKNTPVASTSGNGVSETSVSDKDKTAASIDKDVSASSVTGKDMSATVPSVHGSCTGAASPTTATSTLSSSQHKPKAAPAATTTGFAICDKVLDTEMKNAALTIQRLSEQGSGANLERKLEVLKYIRELAQTMESVTTLKIGGTSGTQGSRHKN